MATTWHDSAGREVSYNPASFEVRIDGALIGYALDLHEARIMAWNH